MATFRAMPISQIRTTIRTKPAAMAVTALMATSLTVAGPLPAPTAAAQEKPHGQSGTTYYVDCRSGSDTSSGTSAGRPWRSLAKASRTYRPGDRLLLRRGTSCTGVLAPTGSGTAALPISVDAYGKGAKPRIDGAGARAAVLLLNVEGWELRNLDLSNTGAPTTTDRRAGLLVRLTDHGVGRHYVVDGVDVHDVNGADFKDPDPSGGILFSVTGSAVPTRFDGVRIEDSTVRHVDRTGIGTSSTWGRRPEDVVTRLTTPSSSCTNDTSSVPRSIRVPKRARCSSMMRSVSYWGRAAKPYGTSGGRARSIRGPSAPSMYVSCPRIGTAASSAARTMPIRSQSSMVLGWIPTAFAYGSRVGSRSTMRQSAPLRRSSAAAVSPTGPAPTTSTSSTWLRTTGTSRHETARGRTGPPLHARPAAPLRRLRPHGAPAAPDPRLRRSEADGRYDYVQ